MLCGLSMIPKACCVSSIMLRQLKVPAHYAKARLLSTTSLLQTYQDETIAVNAQWSLTLSGTTSDPSRGSVIARVDETNNLPTTIACCYDAAPKAVVALSALVSEVHASNMNLTEPRRSCFVGTSALVTWA